MPGGGGLFGGGDMFGGGGMFGGGMAPGMGEYFFAKNKFWAFSA